MFAGIIEKTSHIIFAEDRRGIRRVEIDLPRGWRVARGQSIAIDGICSTVAGKSKGSFLVEYMPQTLSRTTAGSFEKGRLVNLERSLTLKTFIDGHLMQGHVDARARVTGVVAKGGAYELTVAIPAKSLKFIAVGGSIAVNGVALTVAAKRGSRCVIALIPHTLAHTDLGLLKTGDEVNIETDLIARYLAALKRP